MIPPTDFGGGWVCFCVALVFIGIVTAFIGDMAGLLGCCAGMPDALTAITFVALGTSLPDTFASKSAAVGDQFADASIGNVTGSNSVNVFLGLGLPWFMGALFWVQAGPTDEWKATYPEIYAEYPGGAFAVPAGSLGYSVSVFVVCCLLCIALLLFRRATVGFELGGPSSKWSHAGFLAFLWLMYIGLSAQKIYETE